MCAAAVVSSLFVFESVAFVGVCYKWIQQAVNARLRLSEG